MGKFKQLEKEDNILNEHFYHNLLDLTVKN